MMSQYTCKVQKHATADVSDAMYLYWFQLAKYS